MTTPRKGSCGLRLSKLYSFGATPVKPIAGDAAQAQAGTPLGTRVVFVNESHKHLHTYRNNYVSTTKYNVASFFPKALFLQFRKAANLYFLLASVISLTRAGPYRPISMIFPLIFVVGVSMTKEAMEDLRRYKQDNEINNRKASVHAGGGRFEERAWMSLTVGDVVKVEKDNFFPADLLMLSSAYPDGIGYVETMNLDGETNLKLKKAIERTLFLDEDVEFSTFSATVNCENPNPSLYTFVGNMVLEGQTFPLAPQQILLRDSKLRNTHYVYGAVVFSGHDTKVMQNATEVPSKRSRIERRMDFIIFFLFSFLLLISVIGGICYGRKTRYEYKDWWYMQPTASDFFASPIYWKISGILLFVTSLVLYGYLIPISLYVSLEIVKVIQVMFINQDRQLYYAVTDTPTSARTSSLNEELGQVDTILSDKTGTLTCNQMDFLKCSIGGVAYGRGITEVEKATAMRLGQDVKELEKAHGLTSDGDDKEGIEMVTAPHVKGYNFKDERIVNDNWVNEPNADVILQFLRILAVCHTAISDKDESGSLTYEAESPDEAAFVIAARELGFQFLKRTQTSVLVEEFDPETSTKVTRVIFERLEKTGKTFLKQTKNHLAQYGDAGLRTLAWSYRQIQEKEYDEWNVIFMEAKTSIGTDRDSLVDAASELIEKDLYLVGATAVEDKLQKGVPKCIDRLALAGIKIWVLTGDKQETAINIGIACSLLREGMKQIIISLEDAEVKAAEEFGDKDSIAKISRDAISQQIKTGQQQVDLERNNGEAVFALIIDGKSLTYALEDSLKDQLLQLATRCASVICCRVSPKQKAMITRLVKLGIGKTTLGIGDGANDVGMIQEADIGVGISGVEGMQAVMASDFAIAQFCFLERLLIVHGHWCYKRISLMVCYYFYKNITFGLTLFMYQADCSFSGLTIYDDWYMALFNVGFTFLPVMVLGIFEQDLSAPILMEFPALYQEGQRNAMFTWRTITAWMFNGLCTSLIAFFVNKFAVSVAAFRKNGQAPDLAVLATVLYSGLIWVVNVQLVLAMSSFTWLQHAAIWGSILLWYFFLLVYGAFSPRLSTDVHMILVERTGAAALFWLMSLLTACVCLLPYFAVTSCRRILFPQDRDVIQGMRYNRKDIADPDMWQREQKKGVQKTGVGITAHVEHRVSSMQPEGQFGHHTFDEQDNTDEVSEESADVESNVTSTDTESNVTSADTASNATSADTESNVPDRGKKKRKKLINQTADKDADGEEAWRSVERSVSLLVRDPRGLAATSSHHGIREVHNVQKHQKNFKSVKSRKQGKPRPGKVGKSRKERKLKEVEGHKVGTNRGKADKKKEEKSTPSGNSHGESSQVSRGKLYQKQKHKIEKGKQFLSQVSRGKLYRKKKNKVDKRKEVLLQASRGEVYKKKHKSDEEQRIPSQPSHGKVDGMRKHKIDKGQQSRKNDHQKSGQVTEVKSMQQIVRNPGDEEAQLDEEEKVWRSVVRSVSLSAEPGTAGKRGNTDKRQVTKEGGTSKFSPEQTLRIKGRTIAIRVRTK